MVDYAHLLVKEYEYWLVQVHENQGYLGRCVVWCKRTEALDLTDATGAEQEELFLILRQLKRVMERVFRADWFNYAFLGNEMRHLHGHFVPRYSSPRDFLDYSFTDPRWGKNYQTDSGFVTPKSVLEAVRLKLRDELR